MAPERGENICKSCVASERGYEYDSHFKPAPQDGQHNHAFEDWHGKRRPSSRHLDQINQTIVRPLPTGTLSLDEFEHEIRHLPTPCTRAQLLNPLNTVAQGQPGGRMDPAVREAILQVGMQRKAPISGGRRGAKAAPIPANGLWNQVVSHTDELFVRMQSLTPPPVSTLANLTASHA